LEKIKTRVPVHLPNYSESSVGAERVWGLELTQGSFLVERC
jgi:hypothetical protein